jgi:putative pyruvate formate lyase activating enzyme
MKQCRLCPRDCRVDRSKEAAGYCRSDNTPRVSHGLAHFGEEPPISGTRGSGTLFFVGCSLGCVYCQNHQISQEPRAGRAMSTEGLTEEFARLEGLGVHNLNLVTATHWTPSVLDAMRAFRGQGSAWGWRPRLPVVWNTSGYETVDTLKLLEGEVDIWLVDAKYASEDLARRYSRAPDYPRVNAAAIDEMLRQCGHLQLDEQGIATRGVIVRHMALPNHLDDSFAVLSGLYERYGSDLHVSLMAQYSPFHKASGYADISEPLSAEEAGALPAWMKRFGFQGWVQSTEAQEHYVPDFNKERPFED